MNLKISEKVNDVNELLNEKQTRTNKELIGAAIFCTIIGLIIGFAIGKSTTSRNIIKKYNKKYTYDFGDDEE